MKHSIGRHINFRDESKILHGEVIPVVETENKEPKKKTNMNVENIEQMEQIADELTAAQTTKRIKKDKGLIERVESQKTMLTEDNKQLLLG